MTILAVVIMTRDRLLLRVHGGLAAAGCAPPTGYGGIWCSKLLIMCCRRSSSKCGLMMMKRNYHAIRPARLVPLLLRMFLPLTRLPLPLLMLVVRALLRGRRWLTNDFTHQSRHCGHQFFEHFLDGSAGVMYTSFLGLILDELINYGINKADGNPCT